MADPNSANGTIDKKCADGPAGEWKSIDDAPVTARCTLTNSGAPCAVVATFFGKNSAKIGTPMTVEPGNTNSEGHKGVVRILFECSKRGGEGDTCKGTWEIAAA
jgi:hypothetical protein